MNTVLTLPVAFRGRRTALAIVLAGALCAPLSALAQTYTQTEDITYHDNTSKWVLGQVSTRVVNGVTVSVSTYDSNYGLPLTFTSFGKLQETLTWDTTANLSTGQRGTLKTIKDGNDRITTVGSWKRGFPQAITFADSSSKSAEVNDNGWITSVTDETGSKTCYDYDDMGRLETLTQPSEAAPGVCNTSAWSATTLEFEQSSATIYGIPAGHWRQTVNTGNARMIRYFDAMWRPLVTEEFDTNNPTDTKRFQRFAYHPGGQVSFASYPGTTHALTTGTWTEYDALGRVTAAAQDSELGLLTTTTQYLGGFRTRVTNPRGFDTTTAYQAFDEPGYDRPTAIAAPLGAYTHITRDVFGKTLQLRRSNSVSPTGGTGINRTYTYNGNQELCRMVEPETGATLMGYDDAGNLAWSAAGLASGTACHSTGLTGTISPQRVARTYDARNRVITVDYPAGTDDITTTYEADGAVSSVTTGIATLEYDYNRRRLLTSERLVWNANDWLTGYAYTANGHAAVVTYPDGHQVSFAPNALGQATQAGTYATDASYYPNGALKEFTYGNDIVHTMIQNDRQLPETSKDELGATKYLHDTYDYDANGNVLGISDALPGQPGNRDMTYDALDRLTGVTAGSAQGGNAVFAYDVLDNITRLDQGTRTVRHQYDANNRLGSVKNAAGSTLYTYGHDNRGNQISRTSVGVNDSYTFDVANRLTASVIGGAASSYRYDGLGRRFQQIEAGVESNFQYSQAGQQLYSQDGTNRTNHIFLAGSLVAKRQIPVTGGAATTRFQHTDALGSPVAETGETATILSRERMTAYGEPADGTWTSGPGFTGHQMDAGSKLVYMQQRYYDPTIGRLLSADPMASDMQSGWNFNRYNYAANNPFRFTDPDGRAASGNGGPFTEAWKFIMRATTDDTVPPPSPPSEGAAANQVVEAANRGVVEPLKKAAENVASLGGKIDIKANAASGPASVSLNLTNGETTGGITPVATAGNEVSLTVSLREPLIQVDLVDNPVDAPISITYSSINCSGGLCIGANFEFNPGGSLGINPEVGVGGGNRQAVTPTVDFKID